MIKILKKFLREFISVLIRYSGLPALMRFINKNKVTILLYHAPEAPVLEKHLKYLSKNYTFITLDDLIEGIYKKDWDNIPQYSLVLTIDDGHQSNINSLDLFKKYNIKPTIYLCSQIVNTNRHFWFKIPGLNLKAAKNRSNNDRIAYLKTNFDFMDEKVFGLNQRQALNKQEIDEMKDYVDFQSHSQFDPILPACDNLTCEQEIFQCKTDLENLLNRSQKHFAYPNGDYSAREIELLKKADFVSARTINVGWNDMNTNPYELNVTGITDDATVNMMVAQTSGLTMYLSYLVKGSFTGKSEKFKLKKKKFDQN